MMRVIVSLAVVTWAVPSMAGPKPIVRPVDAELERRFHADVERASPAAAAAFDEGTAARDQGRLPEALAAYRKAIELAPDVDHPHRRACSMLVGLGQLDDAVRECERALELVPGSPYDRSGLAYALGARHHPDDDTRALGLAREAVSQLPDDPVALETLCMQLMRTELDRRAGVRREPTDMHELATCSERLLAADPNGVAAQYIGALIASLRRDFDRSRRLLDGAHAAGLDDATYNRALAAIEGAPAKASSDVPGFVRIVLATLGVWLAGMFVLLVTGYVLSRVTLRSVDRGGGTGLRKLYRVVLAACGVYFYLSLPLVLLTVVAAGGGLIVAFFAAGVVPIKLVLIIGIIVIVTVGAIVRSVFVRGKPASLGEPLALADHPRLRGVLDDVAQTVGTRPVDAVYLTPGTDMAVTERAGLLRSLAHRRSERSLIMGVGLFDGMTQIQLRSVLAHEHGHFRNEDTAGGGFALQVRRSLITAIVRLAMSGGASWYNPAWWFLRAYYRIYLGISHGASRLQEVLADRWAIQAYGSAAFVDGYRHVVTRSVTFDRDVDAAIREVVDRKVPMPNLYAYRPAAPPSSDEAAEAIEKEMSREPERYDSHPSPKQRIARAEAMAVTREAQPDDAEPVWSLFADREAVERAMTAEVRDNVRKNHGIAIAA